MRLLVCSLVLMLLTLTSSYSQRTRTVTITPANVLSNVSERRQRQPELPASQLAQYANELVKERGFDYAFDVCDAVPQSYRTKAASWRVPNQMALSNGRRLSAEFTVLNPNESLCGECDAQIPGLQVTRKEILFVAEGKQYRVQRPRTFRLDEAELVDAGMKKVLRTWQLPYQTVPAGISADGTKLYLDFYTQFPLEDLLLELAEDGRLTFRARVDVGLQDKGELIESPAGEELSFMRFQAGDKTYVVRFPAPCT